MENRIAGRWRFEARALFCLHFQIRGGGKSGVPDDSKCSLVAPQDRLDRFTEDENAMVVQRRTSLLCQSWGGAA